MRRIASILTLLLVAAPALATVTITAEVDATNPCKVWIGYTSDEAELIRAFALDITATDGNIIDVNDYAVGDDNGGYGIFPGSFAAAPISVNPTTGEVDNWGVAGYSPVAPPGHPDALGGIGTSGVTIEMGSLYDTAAPSQSSGILCSVTVGEGASQLCVIANAIRGNVVLESAAEVQSLVLPDGGGNGCVQLHGCGPGDCFPTTPDYAEQYAAWVAHGKPDCWCGNVYPEWRFQCDGDFDAATQTIFKYRVYTNDLNMVIPNWKKKMGQVDPCVDCDHKAQTIFKYQIYTGDLQCLIDNWKKKDSQLPDSCPRPDSDAGI